MKDQELYEQLVEHYTDLLAFVTPVSGKPRMAIQGKLGELRDRIKEFTIDGDRATTLTTQGVQDACEAIALAKRVNHKLVDIGTLVGGVRTDNPTVTVASINRLANHARVDLGVQVTPWRSL